MKRPLFGSASPPEPPPPFPFPHLPAPRTARARQRCRPGLLPSPPLAGVRPAPLPRPAPRRRPGAALTVSAGGGFPPASAAPAAGARTQRPVGAQPALLPLGTGPGPSPCPAPAAASRPGSGRPLVGGGGGVTPTGARCCRRGGTKPAAPKWRRRG